MRAGLAAEALDAMQLFLRDPFLDSSLSEIQATLREAVTVDQMHRLIELGNTVEEIVVKSRGEMAFSAVEETAKVFDATNSIFSQEEKTVWYVLLGI